MLRNDTEYTLYLTWRWCSGVRRARSALTGDTAHLHSRIRNSFPFLRANIGILLRQGHKPLLSKYHKQLRSARRNLTKRFPHTNFTINPCVIAIQGTRSVHCKILRKPNVVMQLRPFVLFHLLSEK